MQRASTIHRCALPPHLPKPCKVCRQTKPRSDFPKHQRTTDGYTNRCKACTREYHINWRRANPEKLIRQRASWYSRNNSSPKEVWLRREYGIGETHYNAISARQGGVCALCREPERGLHNSGNVKNLSVDHCHDTSQIRGLLCAKCNKGMGLFGEDPALLRRAANYIEKHMTSAMMVA